MSEGAIEATIWRERRDLVSRIMAVQMDNLRDFWGIRRMDRRLMHGLESFVD